MTTTPPYPEDPNQPSTNSSNYPYGYNHPYGHDTPTPPGGYPPPYGQPPKRRNNWVWGFVAAVAVVVIGLLIAFVISRKDDNPPNPLPTVTTTLPPVSTQPAPSATTEPPTTEPTTVSPEPTFTANIPGSPRAGASDLQFLSSLLLTDSKGVDHSKYWTSRIENQRENVLKLGYAICGAYDDGASGQAINQTMVDKGIPFAEANWVRAAAVVTLCPEHRTTN